MSHKTVAIPLFSLILISLMAGGCAAPVAPAPTASASATSTPLAPATQAPPSPTPAPTSAPPTATPSPFEGLAEWDMVIISDSSLWGVGKPYAKLVEQDNGVKAALHDEWMGGLSAGAILKALRGESGGSAHRKQWPQLVRDAEVLVIFGNPLDSVSPELQQDIEACLVSSQPGGCTAEAFAPYKADLDAIYDEIARLREGRPLILRATDIYNPLISRWRQEGIEDVCRVCWDEMNGAARQAAEGHGVPYVSVYDAFNGPNHGQDPRTEGLIRQDGEHPSEAGARSIAELLQKSGYDYAGR